MRLKGTNIISVSYKNQDPELATLVLKELISVYFTKHLEVHRSADAFNFVAQQSDEVRARLNQTEEELKQVKGDAGITSLNESMTNLNASLARTREALQAAQAELAEEKAVIQEMEKSCGVAGRKICRTRERRLKTRKLFSNITLLSTVCASFVKRR